MNKHLCIKCQAEYEDSEVDAYYCNSCKTTKAVIAAEIDAKLANRPRKEVMSDYQVYLINAKRVHGFPNAQIFGL